jgi:hypothetical protein
MASFVIIRLAKLFNFLLALTCWVQSLRSSAQNAYTASTNILRPENSLLQERWKVPIRFCGKVVDENTVPIPGTEVHLSWTDTSPGGRSQTNLRTDTNGLFVLSGVTGRVLSVDVSKPGYYASKRGESYFDYGSRYVPEPNAPIVFQLRKRGRGADLITSQYGVFPELEFSMPRDGAPVRVDFLNRKVGDTGQLELSAVKPPRWERTEKPEWSLRMSIPDGGFVEHADEFPFEAPQAGYQPNIELHYKVGETNWAETIRKKYYVAFGEPRRYGRITVDTGIYMGMNLGYAINPDGSRDLEPKEAPPPMRRDLPPGVREVIPGKAQ